MAINRALMNRQMYNMGGPSLQAGAPDITLTGDVRPTYSAMRKQRMAYGGIAGLDGRKKYGIGSWFQENIMDPIKENPITSAVIGGGLVNQFGLPDVVTEYLNMGSNVGQNFLGDLIGRDLVLGDSGMFETGSDLPNLVDIPNIFGTGTDNENSQIDYQKLLSNLVTNQYGNSPDLNIFGLTAEQQREKDRLKQRNIDFATATGLGVAAKEYVEGKPRDTIPEDTTGINFQTAQQAMDDPNQRFKPPVEATQLAANGGRIGYAGGMGVGMEKNVNPNNLDALVASYMKTEEGKQELMNKVNQGMSMPEIIDQMKKELMMAQNAPQGNMPMQQPNRMMAAEGGLMNLGGMEKDYREDGGFVPIGGKEKADDVPARLSKNEFVFTADAVRNAGGGDIDQGAQVMEKLMRNLESGGQVSEESQGLDGAREMFETSQRLEKRII